MGYRIVVNHVKLESTAGTLEQYVSKHKSNMRRAGGEMRTLTAAWSGRDFNQFQAQWNSIDDRGSTSQKMVNALDNYAKFLRYSANQYKTAQSKAVNRASWL